MPPRLYLIRHADALPADDDAVRRLSPTGRNEVRHLAGLVRASKAFRPDQAWHSPLVRAKQTAELLLSELKLDRPLREVPELTPETDPREILPKIEAMDQSVALFGHEPHLSALASLLVTGAARPIIFAFQKATLLAIEPASRRWWVRWQVSPDLFG